MIRRRDAEPPCLTRRAPASRGGARRGGAGGVPRRARSARFERRRRAAYQEAKKRIEGAGARCLIALTPPVFPPEQPEFNAKILALDEEVRRTFGDDVVDSGAA
ncbi:MAG TPA: hypothetical protein VNO26_12615 [Candidatus Limnocylindria bacterium]|nr:hypothetical protein [Candidatus Limnocylindria bacterium]